MPKDKRERSVSLDRCKASPYISSSRPPETKENTNEWEDARCPVCMEHPHNAVLLICTSHDKGCRPYMCDTSYRHSNCLDQFRKSFSEPPIVSSEQANSVSDSKKVVQLLVCPLCRGNIKEWIVLALARRFMNAKSRSCTNETCDYTGKYSDLRKHARVDHPLIRPNMVDPERQQNWRRLERQRDLGDLISMLNSFGEEMGGDETVMPLNDGSSWLTVYFFARVFGPVFRSGTARVRRRLMRLWGETRDRENGSSLEDEENDENGSGYIMHVAFRRQYG